MGKCFWMRLKEQAARDGRGGEWSLEVWQRCEGDRASLTVIGQPVVFTPEGRRVRRVTEGVYETLDFPITRLYAVDGSKN
jgi:hypothetical protein